MRVLTADLKRLQVKLLHGGGPDKVAKQHEADKLTARERIDPLIDKDS